MFNTVTKHGIRKRGKESGRNLKVSNPLISEGEAFEILYGEDQPRHDVVEPK